MPGCCPQRDPDDLGRQIAEEARRSAAEAAIEGPEVPDEILAEFRRVRADIEAIEREHR